MDNAHEPAYRPEEIMVLDNRGIVQEIRTAGLTKREAFAMAAMQGLSANKKAFDWLAEEVAGYAVQYADALLAELAKESP